MTTDDYEDNGLGAAVKAVIACSPQSLKAIAEDIGISQTDLRSVMSGGPAPGFKHHLLLHVLGIELSEDSGEYEPRGPYVAIARNKSIEDFYSQLTGGDASPFECVPNEGPEDREWRYYFVNPWFRDPSIVIVPRIDEINETVPKHLYNFEGARRVPQDFYQDVVVTCAKACASPRDNVRSMKEFIERHTVAGSSKFWEPKLGGGPSMDF